MQSSIASDPIKWDDVLFNESDDDELINGEASASLKISKGYNDPLGIVSDLVDPQTDDISYSSEAFNPMKFLLEIHNSSSLQSLEKGLDTMKTAVLDEETRLKTLVKDYFGDFVTARKTIEELEETLKDSTFFNEDNTLVAENNVNLSEEKSESLIAPLQEHREQIYSLQNSLQLFRKYRMMFPTLDNVQEYLNTKQWDKLLKEYSKYKVIIQQTKESNVVLEMIQEQMSGLIQKAIDAILSLLYNNNNTITAEQQAHLISIVIGLDYEHVPELFMIQNAQQVWMNGITFCKERFENACELERIDISVITKKDESHVVLVKLLKDFLHELASRYVSVIQKVKSVLYSLMKRIPDLTTVEESVNEMIQITLSIISSYQQQIEWLFSIGLNTSSIDTILFTTDDILAIFDIVKYDMKENCHLTFGPIVKAAQKTGNTQLVTIVSNITNIFIQKHMLIELTVINNYIKYSFYSINLVLSGVSIESLLLSPYMITEQLVITNTQKELPLLSFYHQITQCCDGIVCHLHGYEQYLSSPVMHFYCNTLKAIFEGISKSIEDPTQASPELLLKHIYTYSYIKTNLIEEPLTKYTFVVKNEELIHIYQSVNLSITELTSAYLEMKRKTVLVTLKRCFQVDWTKYMTLQPIRTEVTSLITSLSLICGDLSLYIGENATGSIKSITNACLQDLITIFQGYKNITEAAYCQLLVETSVLEKAIPSTLFTTMYTLLDKAYKGEVSDEMQELLEKYKLEAYEQMKRIIIALN